MVNGNQLIESKQTDSLIQYTYKNIKPAWRIDIAIAKYATLSEEGLLVFYFPQDWEGAIKLMQAVKNAKTILTEWFGTIPVFEYSIIEIPEGWGS